MLPRVCLLHYLSITRSRAFVDTYRAAPPTQQTMVTCMETLQKDSEAARTICSLVVGTEHNQVCFMVRSNDGFVCAIDRHSGKTRIL
jgi:hypothetical protein